VPFDEVRASPGKRKVPVPPAFDQTRKGRLYVLTVTGFSQPLYVGEIRPDSWTQSLAERMRQHQRGYKKENCTTTYRGKTTVSEDCLLREALNGNFTQLDQHLAKAGMTKEKRAHLQRQLKDRKIFVQYTDYRPPPGINLRTMDELIQLQHAAELNAKNQLKAMIRTNSISFEEEERKAKEESAEYRVL
jgi:hypothetical protein